nr:hypothetical protein [Tanacetum cinerariifolium]
MRIDELHKFSDGTLNDVRNALDDRLKGIRMQYLPQTIWRKGDKDRAAAMIQAIDKMFKTWRIMRSLERFVRGRLLILTDLQETLKGRWRYLVPAESHIHNHMLIPDYQDNKYQDFCYSDELSNLGRTMSSPNNPTSNIEDAFSLNFLDFIPASPDYVPASPGKTYSRSSNSFGVVPIALPSLLLFHDDPYMKVMHAYYAITPSSSMPNP